MNNWDKCHSFLSTQSTLEMTQMECAKLENIYSYTNSAEYFQWTPLSVSTVLAQFVEFEGGASIFISFVDFARS